MDLVLAGPSAPTPAPPHPGAKIRRHRAPQSPAPGSFSRLLGNMAPAEATPPQPPGAPGTSRAQRRPSRVACTARFASGEHPGGGQAARPGTASPLRGPRPSAPAPQALRPHRRDREPQAELQKIPLDGTAAPQMPAAGTARPLPPPFVPEKRPSEAPEGARAFQAWGCHSGRACWGAAVSALGLLARRRKAPAKASTEAPESGRPLPKCLRAAKATHPPGKRGGGGGCGGGGEGHLVITSLPTGGLVSVPGVSRRRGVGGGGGGEEVGGGGGAGYPARLSVLPNRKSYISCNHYEMFLISLVFVCSMCGPRQPLASLSGPGTGTPLLPRSGGEGWRRTSVAVPGTLVAS